MCGKLSILIGTLLVLRLSHQVRSVREKQYWSVTPFFSKDVGETLKFHLPERILHATGDKYDPRREFYSRSPDSIADSSSTSEIGSKEDAEEEERDRGSNVVVKRRKGPTLSVVNPLEILRQRLMLDLARRRIEDNRNQIIANAEILENIGKRSSTYDRESEGRHKKEMYQI